MKIRWTPGARGDLLEIVRTVRSQDPAAARRLQARLRESVAALKDFPEIGRTVPELDDPSIRERIVRPWRVLYRVGAQEITILGIVHGRRTLDGLLDDL